MNSSINSIPNAAPTRQRGAALFISLMFLIVLTLIGLSAANVGLMQERMAGNVREANLAFQSAEAALRFRELDVREIIEGGQPGDSVEKWADLVEQFNLKISDCSLAQLEDAGDLDSLAWQPVPQEPGAEFVAIWMGGSPCAPLEGEFAGKPITRLQYFQVLTRGQGPAGTAEAIVQSIYYWPI